VEKIVFPLNQHRSPSEKNIAVPSEKVICRKSYVISTEATDSLTVRRAVERSLYFALAVACPCSEP
jgi:hypothetical protein